MGQEAGVFIEGLAARAAYAHAALVWPSPMFVGVQRSLVANARSVALCRLVSAITF